MIGVGGEHGQTTGRSPEGPAATGARSDHRPGAPAGAAGGGDRLGLSRWALQLGLPAGTRPAGPADAAGGRPLHPEADAQPLRRGAVRAVDREPVLSVLLRRAELLPPAAVRSLLNNPLAPASGRG